MPADVPSETEQEGDARERFEADAMRRFPGIDFWWSNGERRAKLRGSGIEVWELIMLRRDNPHLNSADFARGWPHVSVDTIESAFRYFEAFPDAISARIARNDAVQEQHLAEIAPGVRRPA